jgi:para-aminobenzoate synthetase
MNNATPPLFDAMNQIIAAVRLRMLDGKKPVLVALDGGSGAGKSTLAARLASVLNAALIQSDDFYAAHISAAEWAIHTPAEKARDVIDWQRLRRDAIEPLLAGKLARWHAFDFEKLRPDGTYPLRIDFVECQPAAVIILDGAYSSQPALLDLIDLSVLVDVPVTVRHERLSRRENEDFLHGWHAQWDESEVYYFENIRPRSSFDLVVTI